MASSKHFSAKPATSAPTRTETRSIRASMAQTENRVAPPIALSKPPTVATERSKRTKVNNATLALKTTITSITVARRTAPGGRVVAMAPHKKTMAKHATLANSMVSLVAVARRHAKASSIRNS